MSSDEIDLFAASTQEDWYPTYRRLRDEAPVYRVPGTAMHVVSRYEDVLHVLRRQDQFPTGSALHRSPAALQVYRDAGFERMTPLSTNPPEHRAYRSLVDGWFDATGAARWQPFIEEVIDDLLRAIEPLGRAEIVEAFALPLPVRVITHILGLPDRDIPQLKAWSEAWVRPFSGALTADEEVWVAEQVTAFYRYLAEQTAAKRAQPGDDLLSALTQASFDGARPLSDQEIISIVDHLYIGGNETTTFAITSALWILLREPGLQARLLGDRSLLGPFIDEVLRLESPTQGLYRRVAEDTELAGTALPAGATIHVRYGAANRDERMFHDPDQVDLTRANGRRHLAFSAGEHRCPGEGLSRLEQRLALDAILDRLPGLRMAPGTVVRHQPGFVLRAIESLPLEWVVR